MAVGDIAYDANGAQLQGSRWVVTGTMEVDTTLRAFAIGNTNTYVHDVMFTGEDDALAIQCILNENASAVATNGTVAVQSNLAQTNTVRYRATMTL